MVSNGFRWSPFWNGLSSQRPRVQVPSTPPLQNGEGPEKSGLSRFASSAFISLDPALSGCVWRNAGARDAFAETRIVSPPETPSDTASRTKPQLAHSSTTKSASRFTRSTGLKILVSPVQFWPCPPAFRFKITTYRHPSSGLVRPDPAFSGYNSGKRAARGRR